MDTETPPWVIVLLNILRLLAMLAALVAVAWFAIRILFLLSGLDRPAATGEQ